MEPPPIPPKRPLPSGLRTGREILARVFTILGAVLAFGGGGNYIGEPQKTIGYVIAFVGGLHLIVLAQILAAVSRPNR